MNNKESTNDKTDPKDTQTNSDPNNNECDTNEISSAIKDRKLFIGYGANLSITEDVLQEFFKQFGEIEKIMVKLDSLTSKPRGFAFITMAKSEHAWKVLNACPLQIKGRQIDVRLADSGPISKKVFAEEAANQASENVQRINLNQEFESNNEKTDLPKDTQATSANQASENVKQIYLNQESEVKKGTSQPLAQQLKRNQQKSHHSFNNAGHSQYSNQYYVTPTTSNLNYSKNYTKPLFQSQYSAKSGTSANYRGAYNGKNPINRNSHFNPSNGKRSVDLQYSTIHEYNSGINTNFNARKNVSQHPNQNRQYLSNSVPNGRRSADLQHNTINEYNNGSNNTSFNGRKNVSQHPNQNGQYLSNSVPNVARGNVNNANKSFNQQLDKPQVPLVNQQLDKPQIPLINQQPQLYYEQLAQPGYYGYQSMPFNDYYMSQPQFNQFATTVQQSPNSANNKYLAHQQNQNGQYLSSLVPNVSEGNVNNSNKTFNQQLSKPQVSLTNQQLDKPQIPVFTQQQQLYYEQLAQQGYYGYQSTPFNYYYAAQPHFNQIPTTGQQSPNAASSQYLTYQPNPLYYYSQYAAQFYQAQPTQQTIQQSANSINQCYANYPLVNQIGSLDNNLHVQQPQQTQQQPQTAAEQNYQALEDRYYTEQHKKVENNLINNFDEKYDGQDIVNNYQPQLINNTNLLNLPYQGSVQQC